MRQVMPTTFIGLINALSQSVKFNNNVLISHALPIKGEINNIDHQTPPNSIATTTAANNAENVNLPVL